MSNQAYDQLKARYAESPDPAKPREFHTPYMNVLPALQLRAKIEEAKDEKGQDALNIKLCFHACEPVYPGGPMETVGSWNTTHKIVSPEQAEAMLDPGLDSMARILRGRETELQGGYQPKAMHQIFEDWAKNAAMQPATARNRTLTPQQQTDAAHTGIVMTLQSDPPGVVNLKRMEYAEVRDGKPQALHRLTRSRKGFSLIHNREDGFHLKTETGEIHLHAEDRKILHACEMQRNVLTVEDRESGDRWLVDVPGRQARKLGSQEIRKLGGQLTGSEGGPRATCIIPRPDAPFLNTARGPIQITEESARAITQKEAQLHRAGPERQTRSQVWITRTDNLDAVRVDTKARCATFFSENYWGNQRDTETLNLEKPIIARQEDGSPALVCCKHNGETALIPITKDSANTLHQTLQREAPPLLKTEIQPPAATDRAGQSGAKRSQDSGRPR